MLDINFFTVILNGLLLGGVFALTGFGLSILMGIMKVMNLAHGHLAILSSYLALSATLLLGVDPFLCLVIIVPIMFALGYIIQKSVINRVLPRGFNHVVLLTFAISIIIENLLISFFTQDVKSLTPGYLNGSIRVLEFVFPLRYILCFVSSLLIFTVVHIFFKKTYIGKAMRAVPFDPEAAEMIGIRSKSIYQYAAGIAFVIIAFSGVLLGVTFAFSPNTGMTYMLLSFGVVVFGGLGSLKGTFIAGLFMGGALSLANYFFGSSLQFVVCYLLVIALLYFKPEGLFGGKF